ncbi:hypothetical protein DV735_g3654, partial [Chaetothyriales sp. CBS 134920]
MVTSLSAHADEPAADRQPSVRNPLFDPSARWRLLNLLRSNLRAFQDQRRALDVANDRRTAMSMEQRTTPSQHREARQRVNSGNERARQFDRRRPYLDALLAEDADTTSQPPAGLSPSNLVRTRRRAFRPSERLTRSMRQRLASTADSIIPSPSSSSVPPLPRPLSPHPRSDSAQRDYADSSHDRDARTRAKRRKLDDGSYDEQPKALTYGHKGQVVPGQLRLEIVSCDGGEYARMPVNSWPQSVLEDNASVYCPNSNRCTILFKHWSGMPFALTKIVIKAPRSGHDAPVREGMVFVALDNDSLVDKSAKYEIYYASQANRYQRQHAELRPSQEWNNAARSPLPSFDRSHYLRDPAPGGSETGAFLASAVVPGFAVTTGEPSDHDEDLSPSGSPSPPPWVQAEGDSSSRAYADRYRPMYADEEAARVRHDYLWGLTSDSEAEDSNVLGELLRRRRSRDTGTDVPPAVDFAPEDEHASISATLHEPPDPPGYERLSSAEPESSSLSTKARDEALAEARRVAAVDGHDTLVPHARFSIPRNRDGVAVNFGPPV